MQPGFTLAARDPFADAKETLSSWDKCMAKDYCKWPVIVAIILGGLVALSVVFCIARCICCGAECAVCCCKCCTCCCGSDSGHRRMKSGDQAYPPPPYANAPANPYAEARSFAPPPPPPQISTQYQSHAPPTFNPQTNPKLAQPPQFATFDAHAAPVNDDALPAMPSWNTARSIHVPVDDDEAPQTRGDVEMHALHYPGSVGAGAGPGPGPAPSRSPVPTTDAFLYENPDRGNQHASPLDSQHAYNRNRDPSPAHSYSQYSPPLEPVERRSPLQNGAVSYDGRGQQGWEQQQRFNSPAPPSYHTTATQPYAGGNGYGSASPNSPEVRSGYGYNTGNSSMNGYGPGSGYSNGPGSGYSNGPGSGYSSGPGSGYGYGSPNGYRGGSTNDPIHNRSQTSTPSAYPGQHVYTPFQPQSQALQGARDV